MYFFVPTQESNHLEDRFQIISDIFKKNMTGNRIIGRFKGNNQISGGAPVSVPSILFFLRTSDLIGDQVIISGSEVTSKLPKIDPMCIQYVYIIVWNMYIYIHL